ncbi:hypothetical protein SLS56_002565 [Neofusicoccum ribis]|uniref:DUF7918 domain-containing protein n=1 Tax=Neofusicoccum ribis TaxID=45134 RepID=A0ABR3T363_9PEZI
MNPNLPSMVNMDGIEVSIKLDKSDREYEEYFTEHDPTIWNDEANKTVRYIKVATRQEFSIIIRIHQSFELRSADALQVKFTVDGYQFERIKEFSREQLPEQLKRLVTRKTSGDRLRFLVNGTPEDRLVKQSFAKAKSENPPPVRKAQIKRSQDDRGVIRVTCTRVLTGNSYLSSAPSKIDLEQENKVARHSARAQGLTHYVNLTDDTDIRWEVQLSGATKPASIILAGEAKLESHMFSNSNTGLKAYHSLTENLEKLNLCLGIPTESRPPGKRWRKYDPVLLRKQDQMDDKDPKREALHAERLKRRLRALDNEGQTPRKRAKPIGSNSSNASEATSTPQVHGEPSKTTAKAITSPNTAVKPQSLSSPNTYSTVEDHEHPRPFKQEQAAPTVLDLTGTNEVPGSSAGKVQDQPAQAQGLADLNEEDLKLEEEELQIRLRQIEVRRHLNRIRHSKETARG